MPIAFSALQNAVEYPALENCLLTLDGRGVFVHAVMGIHVENALQIHNRADPTVYVETMGDVAASMSQGLKAHHCLFSHSGRGDFVVVMPRQAGIGTDVTRLYLAKARAGRLAAGVERLIGQGRREGLSDRAILQAIEPALEALLDALEAVLEP